MFIYRKKLEYPVRIERPNPGLAKIIISQYGGPNGELGASLRYLSQRFSMPTDVLKGVLTDIGTEGSKNGNRSFDRFPLSLCFVGERLFFRFRDSQQPITAAHLFPADELTAILFPAVGNG